MEKVLQIQIKIWLIQLQRPQSIFPLTNVQILFGTARLSCVYNFIDSSISGDHLTHTLMTRHNKLCAMAAQNSKHTKKNVSGFENKIFHAHVP